MKLIIDIPEVYYEALSKTEEIISSQRSGKTLMSVIYSAVGNGTPLDGMTNGEVMMTLFPNENKEQLIWFHGEEWWNSPYQKGGE